MVDVNFTLIVKDSFLGCVGFHVIRLFFKQGQDKTGFIFGFWTSMPFHCLKSQTPPLTSEKGEEWKRKRGKGQLSFRVVLYDIMTWNKYQLI